jgi:glucose/arabinose dehydrogenase
MRFSLATLITLSVAASAAAEPALKLPSGFSARLVNAGVGPARHMVTRTNGDIYVRLSQPQQGKCLVALRDTNGDGRADVTAYFGTRDCGTGLAIDATHLYYTTATELWRVALPPGQALIPTAKPERIAHNLGRPPSHNARSLALDGKGFVYVNIGAPSNSCQVRDRFPGSPGQDPCPLLTEYGGIWRFRTDQRDQVKTLQNRYVTGLRNGVALDWNTAHQQLYLLQHGRDQLDSLFPGRFTAAQSSELPAEELFATQAGDNLGWPYCYYDPAQAKKVLAPEYGGDGKNTARCTTMKKPLVGFPAHYAPNDLLFYTGTQFPVSYRGGAFIAFHGSWNRNGQQAGYNVVFVPFKGRQPGAWQVFADGFAGLTPPRSPAQAIYRPMGLAQTPSGSLLMVDSKKGRIWEIRHAAK